jgi:hypothetical protein
MRVLVIAGAAALALTAFVPAAAAPKEKKAYDPNEEVCKSRYLTGSRLARVTECATRQQWEEMKQQERLGLARKQINGAPACDSGNCMPQGGRDTPW